MAAFEEVVAVFAKKEDVEFMKQSAVFLSNRSRTSMTYYEEYPQIPEDMREQIWLYVHKGFPLDGFLGALFENNLMRAVEYASWSTRALMYDYVKLVYNEVPFNCHGSVKIVESYLVKHREIEAQEKDEES